MKSFHIAKSILPENFSHENVSGKMSSEPTEKAWLVAMREQLGITQEELANELDVTSRTVINWERGHHEPKLTIRQMKKLCRLLGKSIEEIPDNFPRQDPDTKNAEAQTV